MMCMLCVVPSVDVVRIVVKNLTFQKKEWESGEGKGTGLGDVQESIKSTDQQVHQRVC